MRVKSFSAFTILSEKDSSGGSSNDDNPDKEASDFWTDVENSKRKSNTKYLDMNSKKGNSNMQMFLECTPLFVRNKFTKGIN